MPIFRIIHNKYRATFILVFTFICLAGCSTKYQIETLPSGISIFSGTTELGKTPLTIEDLSSVEKKGNGILLRVEDKDFRRVWVWLPSEKNEYSVTLNLDPFYRLASSNSTDIEAIDNRRTLYNVTQKMLDLQTKLLLKENVDVKEIESLIETNPSLGSAHFLLGVFHTNNSDQANANVALKDAVSNAPYDDDFLSLLNEVETQSGQQQAPQGEQ